MKQNELFGKISELWKAETAVRIPFIDLPYYNSFTEYKCPQENKSKYEEEAKRLGK
jgi:hypothetical protein